MSTTLTLEPDAFRTAKAKAAHEKVPLGKAVSDLILQGIRRTSGKTEATTAKLTISDWQVEKEPPAPVGQELTFTYWRFNLIVSDQSRA